MELLLVLFISAVFRCRIHHKFILIVGLYKTKARSFALLAYMLDNSTFRLIHKR